MRTQRQTSGLAVPIVVYGEQPSDLGFGASPPAIHLPYGILRNHKPIDVNTSLKHEAVQHICPRLATPDLSGRSTMVR